MSRRPRLSGDCDGDPECILRIRCGIGWFLPPTAVSFRRGTRIPHAPSLVFVGTGRRLSHVFGEGSPRWTPAAQSQGITRRGKKSTAGLQTACRVAGGHASHQPPRFTGRSFIDQRENYRNQNPVGKRKINPFTKTIKSMPAHIPRPVEAARRRLFRHISTDFRGFPQPCGQLFALCSFAIRRLPRFTDS